MFWKYAKTLFDWFVMFCSPSLNEKDKGVILAFWRLAASGSLKRKYPVTRSEVL